MLVPPTAEPYLDAFRREWPGHGAMMVRRTEALAALHPAYLSLARLGAGVAAWGLGMVGAWLLGAVRAATGQPAAVRRPGPRRGHRPRRDGGHVVRRQGPAHDSGRRAR